MTQTVESPPASPPLARPAPDRSGAWLAVLVPLAVLGALLALLATVDPLRSLSTAPPTEALAIERMAFTEGSFDARVRNDGPEPVRIAQVLVNDAYWNHEVSDRTLDRFESAEITVDYPWDAGLPLRLTVVSSTGLTFEHEVEAATVSPRLDATVLGRYALVGLLVGVLPVAVGLLFLPALRRASATVVRVVLAFTVGLLVILLVETVGEGLELAAAAPGSLGGAEIFFASALAVLAVMAAIDHVIRGRRNPGVAAGATGLATAYLVATGIGLHNAGEGIAIGSAVAAGELALGSALLVGFAAHNTTEGIAIAGPLAADRGRMPHAHLVALVAIAGLPTILGAWAGALAVSPLASAAMFGIAAGAIAQVVFTVGRPLVREVTPLLAGGFVAGMVVMYLTGLLAA